MTTSQGIVKTSVVVAGAVATIIGIAPFAMADDAAVAPESTAGADSNASQDIQAERVIASPVVEEAVQGAPEDQNAQSGKKHQVLAPKAVNSTSVGNTTSQNSPNRIDTSSKEAVRQAFIDRYYDNNVLIQPSAGADTRKCIAGTVNTQAADAVVGAWNFFRGMNNLDAVRIDPGSPLSHYAQKAALSQAAENFHGKSYGLSHLPQSDKFKCGDQDAQAGANAANLAQARAMTAAEQINWWYQDWSGYKKSTMTSDGFNDRLGHRNWLMDPYIQETAYGNVAGYNALSVASSGRVGSYDATRQKNPNATTPETMAWPSGGYFPAELLTSISADEKNGEDVERWSFRVRGADLSHANVTVTGPSGSVPVRVVNSGRYAPTKVSGYGTVLFKMPNSHVYAPSGTGTNTYTVRVTNVKQAPQSTYMYQVKLFNATAMEAKPSLSIARDAVAIEGATTIPGSINATGANNSYQWQISSDGGHTWENAPVHRSATAIGGRADELQWSPAIKMCKTGNKNYACPLTPSDIKKYSFRVRATNRHGTTYSPAIKIHYVHFVNTPSSIAKGQKLQAKLNTSGNDDFFSTSDHVTYSVIDHNGHTIKNSEDSVNTHVNAKSIVAKVRVHVSSKERNYTFYAQKEIAIR